MDELNKARELFSNIRMQEDIFQTHSPEIHRVIVNAHKDEMLRQGVLISSDITPTLESCIAQTCQNLKIPRSCVTAFVYSSREVQADCVIDTEERCILRFTSELVRLLSDDELIYVVGHELGHFLYVHGATPIGQELAAESYFVSRARELSADRLGYLASGNIESALRAILKIASGLDDDHIRFDVRSFLSQIKFLSNSTSSESMDNSHPSLLMRCRSLLWFAMDVKKLSDVDKIKEEQLEKIDTKIIEEFELYVDGPVRKRKRELEKLALTWFCGMEIIKEGRFTKDAQRNVAATLGEQALERLVNILQLYPESELKQELEKRYEDAELELSTDFPSALKNLKETKHSLLVKIIPKNL